MLALGSGPYTAVRSTGLWLSSSGVWHLFIRGSSCCAQKGCRLPHHGIMPKILPCVGCDFGDRLSSCILLSGKIAMCCQCGRSGSPCLGSLRLCYQSIHICVTAALRWLIMQGVVHRKAKTVNLASYTSKRWSTTVGHVAFRHPSKYVS